MGAPVRQQGLTKNFQGGFKKPLLHSFCTFADSRARNRSPSGLAGGGFAAPFQTSGGQELRRAGRESRPRGPVIASPSSHNQGRPAFPSRTAFPPARASGQGRASRGSPTGHDRRRPRGRAKASGDRLGGRAGPRSARAAPVRGVGSAWGSPSRSGPRRGGSASGCPGWRRGFRCVSCQLGAKAGACGGSPSRRSGLASGCLGAGLAGRGADRLGARKAPSSRGRSGVRPRRRDGWRRAGHDRRGPRGRAFIRRGEGLGVRASRGLA